MQTDQSPWTKRLSVIVLVAMLAACSKEQPKPVERQSATPSDATAQTQPEAQPKAPAAEESPAKAEAPATDEPIAKEPAHEVDLSPNALNARIRTANPQYNGSGQFQVKDGKLMAALRETGIIRLGPLRGLPLIYLDLMNTPVDDLRPLAKLPLRELFLESTPVSDISPLRDVPLEKLWLNNTQVADLSPLAGKQITELNLVGTPIKDLSALKGMPLTILWISNTQVEDLSALASMPLVSLTIENTPVSSIEVVKQLPQLERLHIAGTKVTDLTPVAGRNLTRLIFTPTNITKGIMDARRIPTMQEIGVTLETKQPPIGFWEAYDAGRFD